MIVYKTQASDCCGPVVWNMIEDVVIELTELIEDMAVGDVFTITIDEMTEEEFDNLPEFAGY